MRAFGSFLIIYIRQNVVCDCLMLVFFFLLAFFSIWPYGEYDLFILRVSAFNFVPAILELFAAHLVSLHLFVLFHK